MKRMSKTIRIVVDRQSNYEFADGSKCEGRLFDTTYGVYVPMLLDHDPKKYITYMQARCEYNENGELIADLPTIVIDYADLYPSIGFVIEKTYTTSTGQRIITKGKLVAIGLSATPNIDPSIKTIREQLEEQSR